MKNLSQQLLSWYAKHKRNLPWRKTRDPYRIWIAEVLLQQTRVETARPYYARFIARFPNVFALADASLEEVLKVWEGAGYYARARHLHRAAQILVRERDGNFPRTIAELDALPGIGRYTAGAIASIAFNADAPVLDGNVMRVLCRYFGLRADTQQHATRERLWRLAAELLPRGRARAWNQALMELGALICRPRHPRCAQCPIHSGCTARQKGWQNELPVKRAKKELPHYEIAVGVIWKPARTSPHARILIQQRAPTGLLGGLWEFPGGKIEPGEKPAQCVAREIREELGLEVKVREKIAVVKHAYSHFSITLHAFACDYVSGRVRLKGAQAFRWVRPADLSTYPFPAANKKILAQLGCVREM